MSKKTKRRLKIKQQQRQRTRRLANGPLRPMGSAYTVVDIESEHDSGSCVGRWSSTRERCHEAMRATYASFATRFFDSHMRICWFLAGITSLLTLGNIVTDAVVAYQLLNGRFTMQAILVVVFIFLQFIPLFIARRPDFREHGWKIILFFMVADIALPLFFLVRSVCPCLVSKEYSLILDQYSVMNAVTWVYIRGVFEVAFETAPQLLIQGLCLQVLKKSTLELWISIAVGVISAVWNIVQIWQFLGASKMSICDFWNYLVRETISLPFIPLYQDQVTEVTIAGRMYDECQMFLSNFCNLLRRNVSLERLYVEFDEKTDLFASKMANEVLEAIDGHPRLNTLELNFQKCTLTDKPLKTLVDILQENRTPKLQNVLLRAHNFLSTDRLSLSNKLKDLEKRGNILVETLSARGWDGQFEEMKFDGLRSWNHIHSEDDFEEEIKELLMGRFTIRTMDLSCFPERYLTCLPKFFDGSTTLREVNLSKNKLDDRILGRIIRCLKEVEAFHSLDLAGCSLGTGLIPRIDFLLKRGLRSLNLEDNNLRLLGNHIGSFLVGNYFLTSLKIGKNKLGDGVIEILASALENNSTLEVLWLNENDITAEGVGPLLRKLHATGITDLNLSNNHLRDEGALIMAAALSKSERLAVLDLANNSIGPQGIYYIAMDLGKNSSLKRLSLQGNNIGRKGAVKLAKILSRRNTLASLNIASGQIDDNGCACIGKCLETNSSLREVNMSDNHMQGRAMECLMEGLSKNTNLEKLSLCGNEISLEGAEALASVLTMNSTLSYLDISQNKIHNEGLAALCKVVLQRKDLVDLNLVGNNVGDAGALSVGRAIVGPWLDRGMGLLEEYRMPGCKNLIEECEEHFENLGNVDPYLFGVSCSITVDVSDGDSLVVKIGSVTQSESKTDASPPVSMRTSAGLQGGGFCSTLLMPPGATGRVESAWSMRQGNAAVRLHGKGSSHSEMSARRSRERAQRASVPERETGLSALPSSPSRATQTMPDPFNRNNFSGLSSGATGGGRWPGVALGSNTSPFGSLGRLPEPTDGMHLLGFLPPTPLTTSPPPRIPGPSSAPAISVSGRQTAGGSNAIATSTAFPPVSVAEMSNFTLIVEEDEGIDDTGAEFLAKVSGGCECLIVMRLSGDSLGKATKHLLPGMIIH